MRGMSEGEAGMKISALNGRKWREQRRVKTALSGVGQVRHDVEEQVEQQRPRRELLRLFIAIKR